jgi:hypothetical protein
MPENQTVAQTIDRVAGCGMYEPRFQELILHNFKINEAIGYLILLTILFLVTFVVFSLLIGDDKGISISLLPVISFVTIYLNWISKKFLLNS